MHRGFIKLYRKNNEWEWKDKPLTLALFVHLLTNANFKKTKYRGINIFAGQLRTGRKILSRATGLSEQQIRTALSHLKSTNDITIKSTKEYSIISITNWELYQGGNQQNPNEQPSSNQAPTTSKECKEREEGKEVKKEDIYPQEFLDVWAVYPAFRKGNKQKSFTAFKNALKRDSIENINQGVQRYIDSDESKNYPKGFASWFNDDRWKNNYTTQTRGNNDGNLQNKRLGESRSLLEQVRNGAFD